MKIAQIILEFLSIKDTGQGRYTSEDYGAKDPLATFIREFPNFKSLVLKKSIIDFGSGNGLQSIALTKDYQSNVIGIEPNDVARNKAISHAAEQRVDENRIKFIPEVIDDLDLVDLVISKDSMEHYSKPEEVLSIMTSLLKPDGVLLITFGPPWYAPYGSHMHFFCKLPWLNLIFSEKTIMKVRSKYRDDGAMQYEDVSSGLNKMSVKKFELILDKQGLIPFYKKYTAIKGMNFLTRIPVLRELFTNHISVLIKKEVVL